MGLLGSLVEILRWVEDNLEAARRRQHQQNIQDRVCEDVSAYVDAHNDLPPRAMVEASYARAYRESRYRLPRTLRAVPFYRDRFPAECTPDILPDGFGEHTIQLALNTAARDIQDCLLEDSELPRGNARATSGDEDGQQRRLEPPEAGDDGRVVRATRVGTGGAGDAASQRRLVTVY